MAGENPQTTMPPVPREPLIDSRTGRMSTQWERWIQQIQRILSFAGGIAWQIVNKSGSKLSDIQERTHAMLQSVLGWSSTADTAQDKHISNANGKKWDDHVNITNSNPHGTDHDQLDGLADDDHAQYLLLAGRPGQRAAGPLIIGGATHNATIEEDGTVKLNGDATGWRDENFSGAVSAIGPNAPTLVNWDTSSILIPSFPHNLTKELHLIREYDHAGKVAAAITPHAHIFPSNTVVGTVKFFLEYYIKNDGNAALTGTLSATLTTGGNAWEELRLNFPTITSVLLEQGSQIGMRLYRSNGDPGTYAHPVAVSTWGYHYEIDTPAGSRQITAK